MATSTRTATICCAAILLVSSQASAGLTFYTSEAAFDAAAPMLLIQGFETARIPSVGYAIIGNPLDSSTNNSVFSAGSIQQGLSISTSAEHAGRDLTVTAKGLLGDPNQAVYNNKGGDSLDTSFSTPVTAVGMGILNPNGTSVSLLVASPAGSPLGSQVVTVNSSGPSVFFGVIATGGDQIGEIQLLGTPTSGVATDDFAGIDRIVFGGTPAAIPEPASVSLLGGGLAIAAIAGRGRRRAS